MKRQSQNIDKRSWALEQSNVTKKHGKRRVSPHKTHSETKQTNCGKLEQSMQVDFCPLHSAGLFINISQSFSYITGCWALIEQDWSIPWAWPGSRAVSAWLAPGCVSWPAQDGFSSVGCLADILIRWRPSWFSSGHFDSMSDMLIQPRPPLTKWRPCWLSGGNIRSAAAILIQQRPLTSSGGHVFPNPVNCVYSVTPAHLFPSSSLAGSQLDVSGDQLVSSCTRKIMHQFELCFKFDNYLVKLGAIWTSSKDSTKV